jgi:ribosome-associated toxin RatA of RatAB toxin-antitoxin module
MRWILWTMLVLLGVVGAVAIIGWLLPVGHEASRTSQFDQSPQRVYDVVADVGDYASWFEGVTRIEMLDSANGRVRFREHTTTGPVTMEVEEARPSSRFVTRIADPDQPFGGTWTFEITPDGAGTRLTITERGEIYNPIFRFMARFVFGYTGTMDGYLRSLGKKLSSP